MGLLGNLFSRATPLERAEKAFARGDWAEVFSYAADQEATKLAEADRARFEEIVGQAGQRLADMNLEQAEACLRAGDRLRAEEHARLALEQTEDPDQRQLSEKLLEAARSFEPVREKPASDCTSCSNASGHEHAGAWNPPPSADLAELDAGEGWDLFLLSLPEDWAELYRRHGAEFHAAVVAAHGSAFESAEGLFSRVPEAERDHLYRYELACLKLRSGQDAAGLEELAALLGECPDHEMALQVAVDLVRFGKGCDELEPLLGGVLEHPHCAGPAQTAQAFICRTRDDWEGFVRHGLKALAAGVQDPELVVQLAGLHEQRGDHERTESLLLLLGSSGCGGGAHPLLAEFWLRRGRQLDRALESFKGAARNEPGEPRWRLRIAQAYLAKGWTREGGELLQRVLRDENLAGELRQEAMATLDDQRR